MLEISNGWSIICPINGLCGKDVMRAPVIIILTNCSVPPARFARQQVYLLLCSIRALGEPTHASNGRAH
jgi:hypothetical protein